MGDNKFNKRDLLRYIGDTSQLFGVTDYTVHGGRADGIKAVDIKNGSGLELTVLPDRSLDIARLSYRGVNFSYMTNTGIVAPQYFESGFGRNFFGGMLTTCRLLNVGSPCVDEGVQLRQHGRISGIPAEELSAYTDYSGETPVMRVRGLMKESCFFGENLTLQREISVCYGENTVRIKDSVENNGFRTEPFMILYHFNLGYPLLTEDSYLILPSNSVAPRDDDAHAGIAEFTKFQVPTQGYKEQVFYHDLNTDSEGKTFAALINPNLSLGAAIRFNKNQLGRFTQWKQMGEGEYVLGLEPCNCRVEGRVKARQDGTLEFINPGEVKNIEIEIEIIDGTERIKHLKEFEQE